MPQKDIFQKFADLARKAEVQRGTKEGLEWFAKVVRKEKTIRNIDAVAGELKAKRIKEGEMFTYTYDPKLKDKLAFYDTFPLVIVLEITNDGWFGANLHYLPPKVRATLLYEIGYNNKKPNQIVSMLNSNPLTKACMKRYLAKHLVDIPRVVPKEQWDLAVQIPFENFEKAAAKEVWKNSMRKK